jgi:uncharacterized membrane protein YfcA
MIRSSSCHDLFDVLIAPAMHHYTVTNCRYYQRGLVDARAAAPFIAASVPACLIGAHFATSCDERVLKAIYSLLMLSLSAFLVFERDEDVPNATDADKATENSEYGAEECIIDEDEL